MATDSPAAPGAELPAALAALEASGAQQLNPVRFAFIQALVRRGALQPPAIAERIADRARRALQQYRGELKRKRAEAGELARQLCAQYPAAAGQARSMLESNDLAGLRALGIRLQRPVPEPALPALIRLLERGVPPATSTSPPGTMAEQLLRQELDALGELEDCGSERSASTGTELRAARLLRDALGQQVTDKLARRATTPAPGDSGPLNSQRLAVDSMAAMRAISPAYLNRFVTYVDTLLWLEQAGERSADKSGNRSSPPQNP